MAPLASHLAAEKSSMFDALERAATRVGLALYVVHVDADRPTIIYASALLAEFVGRPVEEILGRAPWEIVVALQQDEVRDTIASRGPGSPPITMQCEIERPSGERRTMEVGVARITTLSAELAVCYLRDTTGERETVEALRRSEARFRSLVEMAPDGVVIVQQGRIVLANPVAVRMFGVPDFEGVRGRLLADFLPAADAARAMERIAELHAGATFPSSHYRLLHGDRVVEVHSVLYEYNNQPATLSFVRDATERERLQEHVVRSDRLASLGTMAATVAHEINNPLTYLQLNLQRLEREAATEPDPARAAILREHVANAMHGTERVARIVRDLRAYSRDNADEPETPVDVVGVVVRSLQMVDHDLRHRAQLVCRFPHEAAIVDASPGRLEQIVINLLVNAIQALDGNDPSKHQVSVAVEVGKEVKIVVTDTGRGISEPDRVFEPFFTTKSTGEGSGLGLSVCKQLVERMRGHIELVSVPGSGTKLVVRLPRRTAPVPQTMTVIEPTSCEQFRVLVIDDEPQVRHAMQALLAGDHQVEVVGDGESALAMVGANDYDVILCDLMMPRMNGRDVYQRVREQWPGVERRIVFVTGGAFIPALARFLESVDNLKLRKPFTVENVLAVVREAQRRSIASA